MGWCIWVWFGLACLILWVGCSVCFSLRVVWARGWFAFLVGCWFEFPVSGAFG